MRIHSCIANLVLIAFLAGLGAEADARSWKTTPTQRAQDYLSIQDARANNEIVLTMWIAPEYYAPEQKYELVRNLLRTNAVIVIAHVQVRPTGEWKFFDPTNASIRHGNDAARQPLDRDTLSPALSGFLTAFEKSLSQGIGKLGTNMKLLVFDGAGIESCGNGVLWVDYAGENYSFKTPIPGCK
jgi:hypothetical protein